jgi:hypothetical protein
MAHLEILVEEPNKATETFIIGVLIPQFILHILGKTCIP